MRNLLKLMVFLPCLLLVSPLILLCRLERVLVRRNFVYGFCAQTVALIPGFPGTYLRAAFYFGVLQECSWKVHIGFGSIIVNWPAKLAEHVTTGSYCVLGHVDIGKGVRLASRVSIPSGKRQHLDASGRLSDETNVETVVVGEGSWIGEGAIVMAEVGSHSIVSAGAVVIHPVPSNTIVAGNPARVIHEVESAPAPTGEVRQ